MKVGEVWTKNSTGLCILITHLDEQFDHLTGEIKDFGTEIIYVSPYSRNGVDIFVYDGIDEFKKEFTGPKSKIVQDDLKELLK